jgi:benzoate membrane transport protein
MPLERPVFPLPRGVLHDFGGVYAVNAVVAFLFATTGPVAIILAVGAVFGLAAVWLLERKS